MSSKTGTPMSLLSGRRTFAGRREKCSGQATLLITIAMGFVMLGALGLGIDAATLYGHFQMAQAAADASAQAGILSIYSGTNKGTNAFGVGTGTLTCSSASPQTPCAYARTNGFGATSSSDTITVSYPCSVPGVSLSPDYNCTSDATTPAVHVLVTRPVPVTFIRMLGGTTTNIRAGATAAITQEIAPVPIIVTHPTLVPSLNMGGSGKIQICGGPSQSIQVNSVGSYPSAGNAFQLTGSETVDLSKGGPSDSTSTPCTTGTGSMLGVKGGPSTVTTSALSTCPANFNGVCIGTTGSYQDPYGPIDDPLSQVPYPTSTMTGGATVSSGDTSSMSVTLTPGSQDCPATASSGCVRFSPGVYTSGIQAKGLTVIFEPGLYYISGSPGNGTFKGNAFAMGANGGMVMCSAPYCTSDPGTSACCTGGGMLVYLESGAGTIVLGANSDSRLVGSDASSSYKGILLFVNRSAPLQVHQLGGGNSSLTLIGTIYATNTKFAMLTTPTTYQTVNLQGGGSSGTLVQGEIITSVLTTSGGGSIKMQLNPNAVIAINRIALVQ